MGWLPGGRELPPGSLFWVRPPVLWLEAVSPGLPSPCPPGGGRLFGSTARSPGSLSVGWRRLFGASARPPGHLPGRRGRACLCFRVVYAKSGLREPRGRSKGPNLALGAPLAHAQLGNGDIEVGWGSVDGSRRAGLGAPAGSSGIRRPRAGRHWRGGSPSTGLRRLADGELPAAGLGDHAARPCATVPGGAATRGRGHTEGDPHESP